MRAGSKRVSRRFRVITSLDEIDVLSPSNAEMPSSLILFLRFLRHFGELVLFCLVQGRPLLL